MAILAFVFMAWIFCVMWALVRSDYKHFKEVEQNKDEDPHHDKNNWGI